MEPVRYSVVAPMHNEEGNLEALYGDVKRVLDQLAEPYEILFVNDASTDGTLFKMHELQQRDAKFHFVNLAANVGENWALLAGISKARGEIIITIDGDYQNDPAYIPALLDKLAAGYQVVSGRRKCRVEALWTRRLPSQIANGLIRLLTGVNVHDCGCGLKAYRREVLQGKFVPAGFMNRFSPVSFGVSANQFSEVEIVDRARIAGASHYGLSRIFFVIKDLWVLPFAVRGAAGWMSIFRVLLPISATAVLIALTWHRWMLALLGSALTAIAGSNAINLRRFVEAQRRPLFQIAEYR